MMSLREEILLDKLNSDLSIEKARLIPFTDVQYPMGITGEERKVKRSIEGVIKEIEFQIANLMTDKKE